MQPAMIFVIILTACIDALDCWHCIAADCAEDPSDNYKAAKKSCTAGQSCQVSRWPAMSLLVVWIC